MGMHLEEKNWCEIWGCGTAEGEVMRVWGIMYECIIVHSFFFSNFLTRLQVTFLLINLQMR